MLELNGREIAFVNHPDALLDPKKAFIEAGYSEATADPNAYRLRNKHLAILVEKMRTRLEKLAITPDWIKNEVSVLARSSLSDFLSFVEDDKGNQHMCLKPMAEIEQSKWKAAVKKVKFETIFIVTRDGQERYITRMSEIELYDRQKAILDLAKLLGMDKGDPTDKPVERNLEEQRILSAMSTEDLEDIARIHARAAERLVKQSTKRRERQAIEHKDEDAEPTDQ